jgi:hypothetical protein
MPPVPQAGSHTVSPGRGGDAVHHRLDQRARREVLAGARLDVLRVALQQALVGVALHVGAHRRPVFGVDQVDDHASQLHRVLELVLRLAEDQRQRARLLAELFHRPPLCDQHPLLTVNPNTVSVGAMSCRLDRQHS